MPEIRNSDGTVRRGELLAAADLPALDLDGHELAYIRIDHDVRLQFDDTEVVISTPFLLTTGGERHGLDPAERGSLGPMLTVYPSVLTSASVKTDLTLRLIFDSGATIEIAQDEQYEAWQLVGPGARLIVCPPGIGTPLAVWR